MQIQVGQNARLERTITVEEVRKFADLTGDRNPVHLDPEYAKTTRFGKPIVHGMYLGGLVSNLLGTELPGPGAVYMGQTLSFKLPIYVGETVKVSVTVSHIRDDKPILTLDTVVENESGQLAMTGQATLFYPELQRVSGEGKQ